MLKDGVGGVDGLDNADVVTLNPRTEINNFCATGMLTMR